MYAKNKKKSVWFLVNRALVRTSSIDSFPLLFYQLIHMWYIDCIWTWVSLNFNPTITFNLLPVFISARRVTDNYAKISKGWNFINNMYHTSSFNAKRFILWIRNFVLIPGKFLLKMKKKTRFLCIFPEC